MKKILALTLVLFLTACGGGSDSGFGTEDSLFVGTYSGSTTITLSSPAGTATDTFAINIFVRDDGSVEFSAGGLGVFAVGILVGNSVSITDDAGDLFEDIVCSGTATLSGTFSIAANGSAVFNGTWSSSGVVCNGLPIRISGTLTTTRTSLNAGTVSESGSIFSGTLKSLMDE